MNPLPTLSYTLLSDNHLRKKLRELGIPPDGNKQTMSRRHTEWRNLVNANCDSSSSKTKAELLKELNQWERIQNYTNHSQIGKTGKNIVMEKNFDRDDWSSSHSVDFQALISAARSKSKEKMQQESEKSEDNGVEPPAEYVNGSAGSEEPMDSTTTAAISSSNTKDIGSLVGSEQIPKIDNFGVS